MKKDFPEKAKIQSFWDKSAKNYDTHHSPKAPKGSLWEGAFGKQLTICLMSWWQEKGKGKG